jgi:branched-subunit amino acid aminotransferase/4-amino-4-deoxychorismate lyase
MSRVAYVDGQYLPHRSATVHIEDRGYQFAGGVYEVMAAVGGSLLDEGHHLMRLGRSLAELKIPAPMSNAALRIVMREVIRRNDVRDGIVYVTASSMFRSRGAKSAREAFLTSTLVALLPVVRIGGAAVGDGQPGSLTRKLREPYLAHAASAK